MNVVELGKTYLGKNRVDLGENRVDLGKRERIWGKQRILKKVCWIWRKKMWIWEKYDGFGKTMVDLVIVEYLGKYMVGLGKTKVNFRKM